MDQLRQDIIERNLTGLYGISHKGWYSTFHVGFGLLLGRGVFSSMKIRLPVVK